jgi:hypothetical protein
VIGGFRIDTATTDMLSFEQGASTHDRTCLALKSGSPILWASSADGLTQELSKKKAVHHHVELDSCSL